MFDEVGSRYDITNTVLTGGIDALWRKATRQRIAPTPGELVLDIAAGTAVSTEELSRSGATVIGADFSLGMLKAGRRHPRRAHLPLVACDGMTLPFPDNTFDAVTISFGLRNFVDPTAGLAEMARVTKPGGRLTVCEFSTPVIPVFSHIYNNYLMRALPAVAKVVSSDPESYVYLAESIRAWPAQADLARMMQSAGWSEVGWRNLTGGIVALHSGIKPA